MEARESFLDVRGKIRAEAKRLRGVLPACSDGAVVAAAESVAQYHAGRWSEAAQSRLAQSCALSSEQLLALFGGLLVVARAAARSRLGAKELAKDMESELKMSAAAAAAVAALFAKLQKTLPGGDEERTKVVPALRAMEWRVEVTVSTSSLARVFRPSLLVALSSSSCAAAAASSSSEEEEQKVVFECSRERFQLLRYQVAAALKACEDTSANPILKIE